jgi:hypothetical protein
MSWYVETCFDDGPRTFANDETSMLAPVRGKFPMAMLIYFQLYRLIPMHFVHLRIFIRKSFIGLTNFDRLDNCRSS